MTDTGADSVSTAADPPDLDVYAGYVTGTYDNYTQLVTTHPGKLYLGVTTDPAYYHADVLDVESGAAVTADAASWYHDWQELNTTLPVFYASLSAMSDLQNALAAGGVKRTSYYLWLADWTGDPVIPAGYDAIQYASSASYDSDAFAAYMWQPLPVPPPTGLKSSFYVTGASLRTAWKASAGITWHYQVEELVEGKWVLREDEVTTGSGFASSVYPQKTPLQWRVSDASGGQWSSWNNAITP